MNKQEFLKPIEIWVKEDFILAETRPVPFLMHRTPPDTNPELLFWNQLRVKIKGAVDIRLFNNLEEAGRIVALPNSLLSYFILGSRSLAEVCNFNRKVVASGRIPVVFTEAIEYTPQPGEIVFGMSSYLRSRERTIATPAWLYDLGAKVSPLPKPPVPTIGFVGDTQYVGRITSLFRALPLPDFMVGWMACSPSVNRGLPQRLRKPIAQRVRQKTINAARRAGNLKISFIERSGCYFEATPEAKNRARSEYIQNIQDNAYTLCMRGLENYSYRLYETMSAGRIPIIIDTNMRLPDIGSMKWEEFSVIIPYSEVHRIGDIVQAFHDRISEDDFARACRKSRSAFEYLLPHNFILNALKSLPA
jgi:hypothetical protein